MTTLILPCLLPQGFPGPAQGRPSVADPGPIPAPVKLPEPVIPPQTSPFPGSPWHHSEASHD